MDFYELYRNTWQAGFDLQTVVEASTPVARAFELQET